MTDQTQDATFWAVAFIGAVCLAIFITVVAVYDAHQGRRGGRRG